MTPSVVGSGTDNTMAAASVDASLFVRNTLALSNVVSLLNDKLLPVNEPVAISSGTLYTA